MFFWLISGSGFNTVALKLSPLVPSVRIVMVESIPEGLEFNSTASHPSIFQAWLNLMSEARSSVDIASFYWTLTNDDTGTQEPTAQQVGCSFEFELCYRGCCLS